MTDPPRRDVPAVIESLRTAGIRLAVMTGDQPATAATIAREVGLPGEVVDAAAAGALDGRDDVAVFARVRPEHKLALVRRWQGIGEVVAVTGDGVNDGPALRRADIGVAMGRGGTEVARQAADLVLTDDRLETVVHAVEEGRRIHDNLRRFLGYALSGGVAEVAFVLIAPFFGFLVPLLPGQILWVNMLTHGLPGVAMGAEPAAPDVLRRPPLSPGAPVLDRPLLRRIAGTAALIAAATLGPPCWRAWGRTTGGPRLSSCSGWPSSGWHWRCASGAVRDTVPSSRSPWRGRRTAGRSRHRAAAPGAAADRAARAGQLGRGRRAGSGARAGRAGNAPRAEDLRLRPSCPPYDSISHISWTAISCSLAGVRPRMSASLLSRGNSARS